MARSELTPFAIDIPELHNIKEGIQCRYMKIEFSPEGMAAGAAPKNNEGLMTDDYGKTRERRFMPDGSVVLLSDSEYNEELAAARGNLPRSDGNDGMNKIHSTQIPKNLG